MNMVVTKMKRILTVTADDNELSTVYAAVIMLSLCVHVRRSELVFSRKGVRKLVKGELTLTREEVSLDSSMTLDGTAGISDAEGADSPAPANRNEELMVYLDSAKYPMCLGVYLRTCVRDWKPLPRLVTRLPPLDVVTSSTLMRSVLDDDKAVQDLQDVEEHGHRSEDMDDHDTPVAGGEVALDASDLLGWSPECCDL